MERILVQPGFCDQEILLVSSDALHVSNQWRPDSNSDNLLMANSTYNRIHRFSNEFIIDEIIYMAAGDKAPIN